MPAPTLTVIIPLLTVLATGSLGLLGLIISKESKVSEFRQAWIDSLRKETADLLAASHQSISLLNSSAHKEEWDKTELLSSLREANTALFLIRLRLNPEEDQAAGFLKLLDEMEKYSDTDDLDPNIINDSEKRIITHAKPVLKEAWKTVRNGEAAYRYARASAIIILAILAIIVSGLLAWSVVAS